jgi:hypothetical protein
MTSEIRTRNITPILRQAIRSFGQARAAILAGNVDELIGQLTMGADLLDVLHQQDKSSARRATRKSAS